MQIHIHVPVRFMHPILVSFEISSTNISAAENQKGVNSVQGSSIENQKGTMP